MQDTDRKGYYVVLAAGALLRLALFSYEPLVEHASLRLELATPVSSWKSCTACSKTAICHILNP